MSEEQQASGTEHAEISSDQLAAWAEVYGTSPRQLRRWIARGIECDFPCPLDKPAEMLHWWAKPRMKQRIPPKVLEAAQKATRTGTPIAIPSAPAVDVGTPGADSYRFPAQVARLRDEQQRIQAQLDKARAGVLVDGQCVVNQPDFESLLRQSIALTEILRKAENDLTEWQSANSELIARADVRSENARIAGAIFVAVSRLVVVVRPLLAGKTDAEQEKIWREKTLACFDSLKDAAFTDYSAAVPAA